MPGRSAAALPGASSPGASSPGAPGRPARNTGIDTLRAFVTLLVVLHHSILAYCALGSFDRAHYLASTAPIVDRRRWAGWDVVVDLDDIYFMSLMFLISGLFAVPGIARKGGWNYLKDRLVRLGLPFAAAVTLVMPVAYYPSFLQAGGRLPFLEFWPGLVAWHGWPAGPAWFIGALLAFDAVVVAILAVRPAAAATLASVPDRVAARPALVLVLGIAAAWLAYAPMRHLFGPARWFGVGPFEIQASRVLLYAGFFLAGAALGAAGAGHPVLSRAGPLSRRWKRMAAMAAAAFAGTLGLQVAGLHGGLRSAPASWQAVEALCFAVTAVAACAALVGVAARFGGRGEGVPGSGVIRSFAASAYGVYLVHYAVVTWVQTGLLGLDRGGFAKGVIAFAATLSASWLIAAALRANRVVRRVL